MIEDDLYEEGHVPIPPGSGWFGYSNLPESVERYGITNDEYLQMLTEQHESCAICKRHQTSVGPLEIEHDHGTERVRALACHRCNTGLGLFLEHPEYLRNAAAYIEEHGSWVTRGEPIPDNFLWWGNVPGAESRGRPDDHSVALDNEREKLQYLAHLIEKHEWGRPYVRFAVLDGATEVIVLLTSEPHAEDFARASTGTRGALPGKNSALQVMFPHDELDAVIQQLARDQA